MPEAVSSPLPGGEPLPRILFVDDDADVRKAAALLLGRHGFALAGAATTAEAWSVLAAEPIDVVLLDLNFLPGAVSGAEGMRCLADLLAHDPDVVVVVVTAHSGVAIAVAAMRAGAADFVMKPWRNDRLVATLRDAVALRRSRLEARGRTADGAVAEPLFIGGNPAARRAHEVAARVAPTGASVLLSGEAGSGKSSLALLIHRRSAHAGAEPLVLDLEAGLDGLEAILPGATTLVLDHIDRLAAAQRARLVGWLAARPNLRLVATSRLSAGELAGALTAATGPGADLLGRIGTVEIALPPLRAQADDLPALAAHLLRLFARRHARPDLVWSDTAIAAICADPWPGNFRALRQAIERAVVLAQGPVLQAADVLPPSPAAPDAPAASDLNLARAERAAVEAALRRHGFNVSRAAKELGLTRTAMYRRMARHGF